MLILLRHGQTAANASGLLLGRSDPPLTPLGEQQAAAAAAALHPLGVARVVSSPLVRAQATAAVLGVPVEVDERWIELDYGEYEGHPYREVPADVWDRWRADTAFVPPGGESLAAMGERVRAACEALAEEAADRNVVVVSHVSPIKAAVAWAIGGGDELAWRVYLAVAAISRVSVSPRGPVLVSFNEVAHLDGLA